MYSINFTEKNKIFCLSLHYNKKNSYLFVNGTKIIKFKSKDPEILPYSLCFGNISRDWSVDSMKKTGLNGYVYGFSADYDAISVDDILDIDKYLIKKIYDIKMFGFVKKAVFTGLTISSSVNPLNAALLKFVSMTYWE